ncbi:DUF4433 domain-containing protein [Roseomonas mucosa]|nr:DUF4433 domain-containing protein [Roseomonas mucosa]
MKHGICSVELAQNMNLLPQINDRLRLDGCRAATSLSIGFPNYKMFYRYRCDNRSSRWVVLALHPKILWEKDCVFCCHNAASSAVSRRLLSERRKIEAFMEMFAELEGYPSRLSQKLLSYDPTDVQAEVLVFDTIEPSDIMAAVFENIRDAADFSDILKGKIVHATKKSEDGFFSSRPYIRGGV